MSYNTNILNIHLKKRTFVEFANYFKWSTKKVGQGEYMLKNEDFVDKSTPGGSLYLLYLFAKMY